MVTGLGALRRVADDGCGCHERAPSFGLLDYLRERGLRHLDGSCGCSDAEPEAPAYDSNWRQSWRGWDRTVEETPSGWAGPRGATVVGVNAEPAPAPMPAMPRGATVTGAGLGAPPSAPTPTPGPRWSRLRGEPEYTARTWAPPGLGDRSVLGDEVGQPPGLLLTWEVDIYLSAGPAGDADDLEPYRSCDLDDVSTCDIYRVRWSFASMSAVSVERVVRAPARVGCPGGVGAIQPAISPDGFELAWAESCGDLMASPTAQEVRVRHLGTGTEDEPLNVRGQTRWYPEWVDNNTLFYGQGGGVESWRAFAHASSSHQVTTANPNAVAWNNPRVHPAAPGLLGTEARMLTFGGPTDFEVPVDTDLDGNSPIAFDFGGIGGFNSCHHPVWNTAGTKVMCTRQFQPIPQGLYQEVALYSFVRAPGHWGDWGNPTLSFVLPSEASLDATMGDDPAGGQLFPPAGTVNPSCRVRGWKYAQWCYSEEYIVATLYCTDRQQINHGQGILTSRVVLVHLPTSAVYDLTAAVEATFSHHDRRYHAIFATCGVPGCTYSS